MKTLTLDYSKWRCGGFEENNFSLGKGHTKLLNDQGYMCCLGQFSLQINKKLNKEDIKNCNAPSKLGVAIKDLSYRKGNAWKNTKLSSDAIQINDEFCVPPEQKIKKLRELFKEKGYKIRVINRPK